MRMVNIDLIVKFEGFSATPYLCLAGIPTIGYGSTRYADGKSVELDDEVLLTKSEAMELLKNTLSIYENVVNESVKVELTQNQFDALVSLAYNIGSGNFRKSTLVKKLNASDYTGAADEFLRWNKAGGRELAGLTSRRKKEREIFIGA